MVSKRMSLVDGIKRDEDQLDPDTIDEFLNQGSRPPSSAAKVGMLRGASPEVAPAPEISQPLSDAAVMAPGLIPIHVRVRPEIAGALKTAALQRELRGRARASRIGRHRAGDGIRVGFGEVTGKLLPAFD